RGRGQPRYGQVFDYKGAWLRARPTICYTAPKGDAPTIQRRAERATTFAHLQPPVILVARDVGHFNETLKEKPVCQVFKSGDGITVELTRRREFIQPSPDESS